VKTAARQLFVYYRVPEPAWEQAGAAVIEFQRLLREAHPELQARVLRRPQPRGGQVTLMELYALDPAAHPEGIDLAWLTRIEAAAVVMRRWQQGERHVEWFDPVG
jgi:hypothetical protein